MLITCLGAQERRGASALLGEAMLECSQQLLEGIMSGTHWGRSSHGILSVRIVFVPFPEAHVPHVDLACSSDENRHDVC